MPTYRRRYVRRRPRYQRRFKRRVGMRARNWKKKNSYRPNLHKFTRIVNYPNIQNAGVAVAGGLPFILSDLPTPGDFTTLYDQYRIKYVKVILDFQQQESIMGSTGTYMGKFYEVIDLDDATAPGSEASIQQMQYVRYHQPLGRITRFIKPRLLAETYNDGITSGYTLLPKSTWADIASSNMEHYGWKYYWTATVGGTVNCLVSVKYYLEFKGFR